MERSVICYFPYGCNIVWLFLHGGTVANSNHDMHRSVIYSNLCQFDINIFKINHKGINTSYFILRFSLPVYWRHLRIVYPERFFIFYFFLICMNAKEKKIPWCLAWRRGLCKSFWREVSKLSVFQSATKGKKHLSCGCINSHTMGYDPL